MPNALGDFFATKPRIFVAATSVLLVVVLRSTDYATGPDLSFSIFYLIPVALAAWYAGRRVALFTCLLSAATWFAADYLSADVPGELAIHLWNTGVRLGFFLIVAKLLIQLRAALEVQTSLAQHDSLTGILNGRAFRQRYDTLARLAVRGRRSIALGYLDVDDFKKINDELGHSEGDRVLRAVADCLAERLRASDFVARLGGDEFAILLADVDIEGARTVFAQIRDTLQDLARRNRWPIGLSIGVIVFRNPPATIDEAIHVADELMYSVKNSGKNDLAFREVGVDPPQP